MVRHRGLLEGLELVYAHHPRAIMLAFIALFYLLNLVQSYLALPRSFDVVFVDTWEVLVLLLPVAYVIWRTKPRNLLGFGLAYLLLGISVAFFRFPLFVKPEYAPLSFLMGVWFLADWYNYRVFKKSLLYELINGNYYLAGGLFLSVVVLGSVVEILNAAAGLWAYRWSFPSLEVLGVPLFTAVFGWFPWLFAVFEFIYPLAMRKPKR